MLFENEQRRKMKDSGAVQLTVIGFTSAQTALCIVFVELRPHARIQCGSIQIELVDVSIVAQHFSPPAVTSTDTSPTKSCFKFWHSRMRSLSVPHALVIIWTLQHELRVDPFWYLPSYSYQQSHELYDPKSYKNDTGKYRSVNRQLFRFFIQHNSQLPESIPAGFEQFAPRDSFFSLFKCDCYHLSLMTQLHWYVALSLIRITFSCTLLGRSKAA